MTQHAGPGDPLTGLSDGTSVAGLARRVVEVYGRADDDLRHAVHDSLLAGLPQSVLADDLDEPGADPEQEPGVAVAAPPAGPC